MSPASKSKSKDKSTPRAGKEHPKVSIKPSPVHSNGANGSSASAYNPALGTFHTLEISTPALTPPTNGRFRTMDDPEDHSGNSPGTTAEYDSFSNNGSCSGESEDPKEKPNATAPRVETTPGCDADKRDKIRQKNERKHQRQKEKRAQDLHERCNSFLTSRKVEALSHQLVMMGFPSDRAMMAIIANEGRMEESVAWLLLEGDDENNRQEVSVKFEDKFSLKVDISDELAQIAAMEAKYRCTKQDVERAVVAYEGDLPKAEENLRSLKQTISAAAAPKLDEPVDSAGPSDKISPTNPSTVSSRNPAKGASSTAFQQPMREERDLNHRTPVRSASPQESANINLQQALKKMQPRSTDWSRVQVSAIDNRWATLNGSPPVSYPPLSSPVQVSVPTMKSELPRFASPTMGYEVKTSFQAAFKEPIVVMRRPKQNSSSSIDASASPPTSSGWYPNVAPGVEILTGVHSGTLHNLAVMGTSSPTTRQIFPQNNLHRRTPSGPAELTASAGWSGGPSWNAPGTASSSLAVPSSLGLFTGWGASPGSSKNDWNTGGLTPHRDYTSIDWSLDLTPLRPSSRNDAASDAWPAMFMGGNAARPLMNGGGRGVYLPGLQERGGILTDGSAPASSHEWTNPFEGKDLFRVPRQYVTSSPTL